MSSIFEIFEVIFQAKGTEQVKQEALVVEKIAEDIQKSISDAYSGITGMMGNAIGDAARLVDVYRSKTSAGLQDSILDFRIWLNQTSNFFRGAGQLIASNAKEYILSPYNSLRESVTNIWGGMYSSMSDMSSAYLNAGKKKIYGIGQDITDMLLPHYDNLKNKVIVGIDEISSSFNLIAEKTGARYNLFREQVLSPIVDDIGSFFHSNVVFPVKKLGDVLVDGIGKSIEYSKDKLGLSDGYIKHLSNVIVGGINKSFEYSKDKLGLSDKHKDFLAKILKPITEMPAFVGQMGGKLGQLLSPVHKVPKDLLQGVNHLFKGAGLTVKAFTLLVGNSLLKLPPFLKRAYGIMDEAGSHIVGGLQNAQGYYKALTQVVKEYVKAKWEAVKASAAFIGKITGFTTLWRAMYNKGDGKTAGGFVPWTFKVTGVTAAIGLLKAYKDGMWDLKSLVDGTMGAMFQPISDILYELQLEILPIVQEILVPMIDVASNLLKEIVEIFKSLMSDGGEFSVILGNVVSVLKDIGMLVGKLFGELVQTLLPPLLDALGIITRVFLRMVEQILPVVVSLFNSLLPVLVDVLHMLVPLIDLIVELLAELLPLFLDNIVMVINLVIPLIQQLMPALIELVKQVVPVIAELMKALMPVIGLLVKSLAWILGNIYIPTFMIVLSGIIGVISSLISMLTFAINLFSDFFKMVKDFFYEIPEIVSDLLSWVSDAIMGVFSSIWEGITGLFGGVLGWLGLGSSDTDGGDLHIDPVTPFASGGIVTGPTRALIGEAGTPEMVLPLKPEVIRSVMPGLSIGGDEAVRLLGMIYNVLAEQSDKKIEILPPRIFSPSLDFSLGGFRV